MAVIPDDRIRMIVATAEGEASEIDALSRAAFREIAAGIAAKLAEFQKIRVERQASGKVCVVVKVQVIVPDNAPGAVEGARAQTP